MYVAILSAYCGTFVEKHHHSEASWGGILAMSQNARGGSSQIPLTHTPVCASQIDYRAVSTLIALDRSKGESVIIKLSLFILP
jgi:hypothetical protein